MPTLLFRAGLHTVTHAQPVIASDRQIGVSQRGYLDTRVSRVWSFNGRYLFAEGIYLRQRWALFEPEWTWTPPDAGSPIKVAFGNSFQFVPVSAAWADLAFSLEEILSPDT